MFDNEEDKKKTKYSGASAAGNTLAQGGSAEDAAVSGLSSAAMSSGNPYAIGGAFALQALSGAQKAKQAKLNAQKKERTSAIDTYLQAIDRMA